MKILFNKFNVANITLFQWDFGQTLEFDNIDLTDGISEVHFPIPNSSELAVVEVNGNKCRVPDATLTLARASIDAYLFIKERKPWVNKSYRPSQT